MKNAPLNISVILLVCNALSLCASGNFGWQYVNGELVYQRVVPKITKKADKEEIKKIEWKVVDGKVESKDLEAPDRFRDLLDIHTTIQENKATKKLHFKNPTVLGQKLVYEEDYYRVKNFKERKEEKESIIRKFEIDNAPVVNKNLIEAQKQADDKKKKKEELELKNKHKKGGAEFLLKTIQKLNLELITEKKRILKEKVKKKSDVEKYEAKRARYLELRKQYEKDYVNK